MAVRPAMMYRDCDTKKPGGRAEDTQIFIGSDGDVVREARLRWFAEEG